jgi:hypothetical protein
VSGRRARARARARGARPWQALFLLPCTLSQHTHALIFLPPFWPLPARSFDVIKSRIQSSTTQGKNLGIMSVARELVAAEGVAGLYRGLAPALIRAVPANAACFLGIETSRKFLDQLF